jgi:hypothetical protein
MCGPVAGQNTAHSGVCLNPNFLPALKAWNISESESTSKKGAFSVNKWLRSNCQHNGGLSYSGLSRNMNTSSLTSSKVLVNAQINVYVPLL